MVFRQASQLLEYPKVLYHNNQCQLSVVEDLKLLESPQQTLLNVELWEAHKRNYMVLNINRWVNDDCTTKLIC